MVTVDSRVSNGQKCINVKRFIFTGTPGSGKTSVIQELGQHGYRVIHEAATDVIGEEQVKGIGQPWEDSNFCDKIVRIQKERQMSASGNLQFYDRSPFCSYALAIYLSQRKRVEFVPSSLFLKEINRCLKDHVYQNKAFFFENLGFVVPTHARTINYEEALIFEKIHLDVYSQFGFEIVKVPKGRTVTERCKFILELIV